jgi:Zn-dependent protease with chaperone function
MSTREYDSYVERRFPAVASADSLPFLGLPLSTVRWILLGFGGALIGLGATIWRTRGRGTLILAAVLGVAVTQVTTEMAPALAHRLHVTPAALERSIATNYLAVAKGLAAWPSIKPGAGELVRRQVASVPDAATQNGLGFTPLPWYIMGPAIALLLTGGIALAAKRQSENARIPVGGLHTTGARTS